MQSLSVYDNGRIIALNFNLNTKLSETTDSRETVGTREKVVDLVVPFAIEPNIMQRWEMDLSPGIVTFPFNPVILHNSIILFLISAIRLHR